MKRADWVVKDQSRRALGASKFGRSGGKSGGGRERHLIEDAFTTQKNNGIGLEPVFCANATASKNYYTMMQAAQILWILTRRKAPRVFRNKRDEICDRAKSDQRS